MDRRSFLSLSASGLVGLGLAGPSELLNAGEADGISRLAPGKGRRYSVVVIGDTHFDLAPESVYHSLYDEPVEWLNRVQREEFARNGEMWKERFFFIKLPQCMYTHARGMYHANVPANTSR